jgi:catechol 2,3-dioxygenase-like lactoylglutathione lyase family enzyme
MSGARIATIGVIVSDLERAARFYRELGLEFPEPLDPEGHGHVESSMPGDMRFMLDTVETIRSFDPDWEPPTGGHRVAVGFECDSPGEVDEAYARLLEVGGSAHKEPWDAFWGMRYAQIADPDGNVVDLFANLE